VIFHHPGGYRETPVRRTLWPVGAPIDLGGAPMATRMVGGFILVAFILCVLLAWPGRRRWPLWLIAGLSASLCAALTLSLSAAGGWLLDAMRLLTVALAAGFLGTAAVRDLR
jgi:4-hydroxybenzoate polyprenyltransferase